MSPETQATEVDFSIENELDHEYEPLPERGAEAFETTGEYDLPEAKPAGTLEYANDNAFVFRDGELIEPDGSSFTQKIAASDNVEAARSHQDVIRQFDEAQKLGFQSRQEVWLPDDRSPDGKTLYQTRMWLNPDGSGGYEIRSILIPENDNDESSDAERETSSDGVVLEYPYEIFLNVRNPEIKVGAREQLFASAEVDVQDFAEIVEPVAEEMLPANIVELAEGRTPVVERDQEHASVLNELLMDRLPAFDVEAEDVVVLKAPMSRLNLDIAYDVRPENVTERDAAPMMQTTDELAQAAPAQKIEHFPEGAITQINKPREVISSQSMEVMPIAAERTAEQPVLAEVRSVEKQRAPKVEEQLDTKKEDESGPRQSNPEKFRIRRGREMRFDEYRAPVSHHESEEVAESTPRSIAESAVIKMLERFAPAIEEETREVTTEQVRENPIATLEVTPRIAVLNTAEQSPRWIEKREDEAIENRVVSFETAESERPARAEIDEVLAAHGLSRTSKVEIAPVTSVESLMSTPSQRPQLADVANDNQRGIVTKRGPVTMRRAA